MLTHSNPPRRPLADRCPWMDQLFSAARPQRGPGMHVCCSRRCRSKVPGANHSPSVVDPRVPSRRVGSHNVGGAPALFACSRRDCKRTADILGRCRANPAAPSAPSRRDPASDPNAGADPDAEESGQTRLLLSGCGLVRRTVLRRCNPLLDSITVKDSIAVKVEFSAREPNSASRLETGFLRYRGVRAVPLP